MKAKLYVNWGYLIQSQEYVFDYLIQFWVCCQSTGHNNNHNKYTREMEQKLPRLMNIICYTTSFNSNRNYNLLIKIAHFNLLKKFLLLVISMCLSSLFFFFKHNIPLRGSYKIQLRLSACQVEKPLTSISQGK